jgi:hypothetical protein
MVVPTKRPTMSERRRFTSAFLAVLGSLGCRKPPPAKRTATMAHEPWLLWPEGEPPPGGFPLLVFLHGMGEAAWTERGGEPLEQGPDALLANGTPVALFRSRDARVPTLWQSFVLLAPQAFNDEGLVADWDWSHPGIKRRVIAEVEQISRGGKVNMARLCAVGFSRGGAGVYRFDAGTGPSPLPFRKIASVDAQDLWDLRAAVERQREVRAYYAPSTYEDIRRQHEAAEKVHGKSTPPVSLIARPQKGNADQSHAAIGRQVLAEDDLYRWLLA